jgi:hypothetical protein
MGSTRAGSKVGAVNSAPSSEQRRPRSRLFGVRGDQGTSRSLMIAGIMTSNGIGLLTVVSAACVILLGLCGCDEDSYPRRGQHRAIGRHNTQIFRRNMDVSVGVICAAFCVPRAAKIFTCGVGVVTPRLLTSHVCMSVAWSASREEIYFECRVCGDAAVAYKKVKRRSAYGIPSEHHSRRREGCGAETCGVRRYAAALFLLTASAMRK